MSTKRATKAPAKPAKVPKIPDPFSPASPDLEPFLSTLNPAAVYITHIDRHPVSLKKQIFTVPVSLNLAFVALLFWRLYVIVPFYFAITASGFGYINEHTIPTKELSWKQLGILVLQRTGTVAIDWVLATIVAPWPATFFLERPGNPVRWRWRIGFRESEIVVRVSRGWNASDLLEAQNQGQNNPFFKVRILPAIARDYIRSKSGYLMMGKDWDLDFGAMITAETLRDKGVLEVQRFQKSVWIYVGDKWAIWECWKLDTNEMEAEARKKIILFKDRLTAMGKENLFFRWVEVIQYETSRPGGFTKERQVDAANRVRELFSEQGMDFEEFVRGLGGLEGLPGWEEKNS